MQLESVRNREIIKFVYGMWTCSFSKLELEIYGQDKKQNLLFQKLYNILQYRGWLAATH